jgi:hypothetical protein
MTQLTHTSQGPLSFYPICITTIDTIIVNINTNDAYTYDTYIRGLKMDLSKWAAPAAPAPPVPGRCHVYVIIIGVVSQ